MLCLATHRCCLRQTLPDVAASLEVICTLCSACHTGTCEIHMVEGLFKMCCQAGVFCGCAGLLLEQKLKQKLRLETREVVNDGTSQ